MMNRLRDLADRLGKPLLNKNLDFVPLNHFAVVTDEDVRLVLCKDSRRLQVNHNLIIIDDPEPPPINESISGVNPGKLWTTIRGFMNGTEALYGGTDYRISAAS